MDTKEALTAHMKKGKNAHPDANVKKLAKGGPTSANMKAMGRNLARAANQRGTSRGR
jgi:gluconate kinase